MSWAILARGAEMVCVLDLRGPERATGELPIELAGVTTTGSSRCERSACAVQDW